MASEISKKSKFISGRYRMNEDETVADTQFLRKNTYTGAWDVAMGRNDAQEFNSADEAQQFIDEVSGLSAKWNKTPYQYFIRELVSQELEVHKSDTIPPKEEEPAD